MPPSSARTLDHHLLFATVAAFVAVLASACGSGAAAVASPTDPAAPPSSGGSELEDPAGVASAPRPEEGAVATPSAAERSCSEQGDRHACVEAGDAYTSLAVPDFERAMALYARGCDEGQGDGEACARVASLLRDADDPDAASIARCLDLACASEVPEACLDLGFMHLRGAGGTPRDLDRARALFQPLCDDGFENGCLGVAVLLAMQASDLEMGLGGRPDARRARTLYQRSCEAYEGGPGCFQLDRIRGTHHFEVATYQLRLATVEGAPAWLRRGQRCEISVEWTMDEDPVSVRATCAGRPIFPTDSAIAWSEEGGFTDTVTTQGDGNPSLVLDPAARTFELGDDATGRLGALRLTGTVTSVPPPSE